MSMLILDSCISSGCVTIVRSSNLGGDFKFEYVNKWGHNFFEGT